MKNSRSAAKKKSVSRTQIKSKNAGSNRSVHQRDGTYRNAGHFAESKNNVSDRIPDWKHKRAMKALEKLWKICPKDDGPTDVSEKHDFYLTQE